MFESIKDKKILIVGSRSRLGFRIHEEAKRNGLTVFGVNRKNSSKEEFIADIRNQQDICDLIKEIAPHMIVHAAALTDVDLCQKDQRLAWDCNVLGSENVALAAKTVGARLIYVSTDYVFDGKEGPYGEDDLPSPINYYGWTKLEGEKIVQSVCKNALTIRTCVPYDWNPVHGPNFLMWVVKKLESHSRIRVVTDQWSTPTFVPHLARAVLMVCGIDLTGVIHAADKDFLSRYDFALLIAKEFGLDPQLIDPIQSQHFPQAAPRPLRAGLRVETLAAVLKSPPLSIREGVAEARRRSLPSSLLKGAPRIPF